MVYEQKVRIKNISLKQAKLVFNDKRFLLHLIKLQPVRVIRWDGTYDGAKAHMKFWFLFWNDFQVEHKNNKSSDIEFSFEDHGLILPFSLNSWKHKHVVKKDHNDIIILDNIEFEFNIYILGLFIYPILVFPILIRRVLYRTFNWRLNNS